VIIALRPAIYDRDVTTVDQCPACSRSPEGLLALMESANHSYRMNEMNSFIIAQDRSILLAFQRVGPFSSFPSSLNLLMRLHLLARFEPCKRQPTGNHERTYSNDLPNRATP
jgi:hypothetical protein